MSRLFMPTIIGLVLFASLSVAQNQFLRFLSRPSVNVAKSDVTLGTNGKIAFVTYFKVGNYLDPQINVMNPDGSEQKPLLGEGAAYSWPAWSPDGSKIAFANAGEANVFIMNADGSNRRQITSVSSADDMTADRPAWLPDGKKIAFITSGILSSTLLNIMNADASFGIDPNGDTHVDPPGTEVLHFYCPGYYVGKPAWSPDGTRIAITARANEQLKDCVFVMNANGSGATCIADKTHPSDLVAWSPDGAKVLYSRVLDPNDPFHSFSNLYLVNRAGGIPTQLTNGLNHDTAPVWSPDGSLIAFSTDRNRLSCDAGSSCSEILLMNPDGSNQRPIANPPVIGSVHDWQSLTQKQVALPVPATLQLSAPAYFVYENYGPARIVVTRLGDLSGEARVDFAASGGTASPRSDYIPQLRSFRFAPGEGEKVVLVPIVNNGFVQGDRTVNLTLSNPQGAPFGASASAVLTITDDDVLPPMMNPLDTTQFFVTQQYNDFLSRPPDQNGLNYWIYEIAACAGQGCTEAARINVSAAFFLSIEFQQTGFLVERAYKAAFGDAVVTSALGGAHQFAAPIVRFDEFLPDTQQLGQDLIVGQSGWETVLENNKETFLAQFVQRSRFATAFPGTMTPTQFVDKLNTNAGNVLSPSERAAIIALFGSAADTSNTSARAQALRQVAENQKLSDAEFNRAFVLMEYLGYLRRNPDEGQDRDYTGYDFWLTKLNQFNGNFIKAEMVKAFITSAEYRQRFGP